MNTKELIDATIGTTGVLAVNAMLRQVGGDEGYRRNRAELFTMLKTLQNEADGGKTVTLTMSEDHLAILSVMYASGSCVIRAITDTFIEEHGHETK